MNRYSVNISHTPAGGSFGATALSDYAELLSLGMLLGKNIEIVDFEMVSDVQTQTDDEGFVIGISATYSKESRIMFDLPFLLSNDKAKRILIDSNSNKSLESLNKPYAISGRYVGLFGKVKDFGAFKNDIDDYLLIPIGETYQFVFSVVNSTLTDAYKPFDNLTDLGIVYFDKDVRLNSNLFGSTNSDVGQVIGSLQGNGGGFGTTTTVAPPGRWMGGTLPLTSASINPDNIPPLSGYLLDALKNHNKNK